MTPAQAKWLTKLRDEGPTRRPRYGAAACVNAFRNGWTEWADAHNSVEVITAEGLLALALHEVQP